MPNWLVFTSRIGSFEILNPPQNEFLFSFAMMSGGKMPEKVIEWENLRILAELVQAKLFGFGRVDGGGGSEAKGAWEMVREIARRNARMVAGWQAWGFMHGTSRLRIIYSARREDSVRGGGHTLIATSHLRCFLPSLRRHQHRQRLCSWLNDRLWTLCVTIRVLCRCRSLAFSADVRSSYSISVPATWMPSIVITSAIIPTRLVRLLHFPPFLL
jgi:hypothetical protein